MFFWKQIPRKRSVFCHAISCYLVSADCTDGRIHRLQRHLCFVRVRPPRDLNRCLPWRSWPFKTIVGVRKQQVTTVTGTSASSGTNIWAVLLNDLHGTIMHEAKMQANRVRDLATLAGNAANNDAVTTVSSGSRNHDDVSAASPEPHVAVCLPKAVAPNSSRRARSAGGQIGPSCSTNGLALLMFAQRLTGAGWKPAP